MKKIWIIISIVLAVIPVVLAFSGVGSNYKVYYGIDGIDLIEGSSANYKLKSSLLYQPAGKFESTNYKLSSGPYYVQDAVTTTTTSTTTTTIPKAPKPGGGPCIGPVWQCPRLY